MCTWQPRAGATAAHCPAADDACARLCFPERTAGIGGDAAQRGLLTAAERRLLRAGTIQPAGQQRLGKPDNAQRKPRPEYAPAAAKSMSAPGSMAAKSSRSARRSLCSAWAAVVHCSNRLWLMRMRHSARRIASSRVTAIMGSKSRAPSSEGARSGSSAMIKGSHAPCMAQRISVIRRAAGTSERRRLSRSLSLDRRSSRLSFRNGNSCQSPRVQRCARRRKPFTFAGCPS